MTTPEIPIPGSKAVEHFIKLGRMGMVNNYILAEEYRDVPVEFTNAMALIQLNESKRADITTSLGIAPAMPAADLCRIIRAAAIPDRVVKLGIADYLPVRREFARATSRAGLPYAVFAVGVYADTKQEAQALFSIYGYSPQALLVEFQESAANYLRTLQ
jgi:hypothetical protein